jgi:hypothetical protein
VEQGVPCVERGALDRATADECFVEEAKPKLLVTLSPERKAL